MKDLDKNIDSISSIHQQWVDTKGEREFFKKEHFLMRKRNTVFWKDMDKKDFEEMEKTQIKFKQPIIKLLEHSDEEYVFSVERRLGITSKTRKKWCRLFFGISDVLMKEECVCGKVFRPYCVNQSYCSRECYDKHNDPFCRFCGEQYHKDRGMPFDYWIIEGFCSSECCEAWRTEKRIEKEKQKKVS